LKQSPRYLVFDVESVPDATLIKKVKYPNQDISSQEAVQQFQEEILSKTNGQSSFIPVTFQYPISICLAKVRDDFSLFDLVSLDEPSFRTSEMVKIFWQGIENLYPKASLVTFNGRGFDFPLLELMAYRYGYKAKNHFKDKFGGRYRFGVRHLDLQDWISNYSAIKVTGGLNLLAKIIGKPGKMNTKGDQVYDLFLQNKLKEINDYCYHDVLDTYFVFLRTRVMLGELTLDREQELLLETKKFITGKQSEIPALQEYLKNWGDWTPWP